MSISIKEEHLELLRELINIGVGKGGEILNKMLGSHITLDVPDVTIVEEEHFLDFLLRPNDPLLAAVNMEFLGALAGTVNLVFRAGDVDKLVILATGGGEADTGIDMESLRTGSLLEIGNVVINGVVGTLSNILHLKLNYSIPAYLEGNIKQIIDKMRKDDDATILIIAKTRFRAESLDLEGDLIFFLGISSYQELVDSFGRLTQ
ncbi:chemotaxis protein CheC [Sediminispirochaeta smaragdinae]|uniref:CheC, inhibitor of MCP methylation n=1 Tax=Sediminispirochaeta smaragdinae (strain DSM 11293 / JCM 15392 / SEBR 4228) TaxID=573413 RepID=E1R1Q6_SEDSS|nr:chemotaxis protein CheC [Sediminispirochaeta smaragdinae]ADK81432.1 CheC, inhibitor of MCP methylation [Sediminispirochaeta smaragdinae DSM 11293]